MGMTCSQPRPQYSRNLCCSSASSHVNATALSDQQAAQLRAQKDRIEELEARQKELEARQNEWMLEKELLTSAQESEHHDANHSSSLSSGTDDKPAGQISIDRTGQDSGRLVIPGHSRPIRRMRQYSIVSNASHPSQTSHRSHNVTLIEEDFRNSDEGHLEPNASAVGIWADEMEEFPIPVGPSTPVLDGSFTNKNTRNSGTKFYAGLAPPVAMFRSESDFSLMSIDTPNHHSKSTPEISNRFLNKLASNNNEGTDSDKSQQGSPVAVSSSRNCRKSSRASTKTSTSLADGHSKRETKM
mmetsp:Transcript_3416/g.4577  ORF Transcript_3416/g.4577 Transcript_3416/m.4577 type:complete len:299 (+) Transcript_3416:51-947(+)